MDILITPECYKQYFAEFNFLNGACFTSTLSKLLGFTIIVGCSIVKIPQILKIYENQSGEGISIASIILEMISYTIYMTYSYLKNFPFSQWGETSFLALQTLIIGILVLHYEGANEKAAAFGIIYLTSAAIFMSGLVPVDILWGMQSVNILILLSSKSIQIYTNYKNGNTGQLSAVSINLLFLGTVARIFTSIQETGDFITILANSIAAVANGILAGQIWYYWDETKRSCFKSTLSKLLGILVITGCSILKIPQIIKIYENKSGEGISMLSVALELVSYTIYMSYNYVKGFSFTQWGEVAFLTIQTLIIAMLILHYDDATPEAGVFGTAYSMFCLAFMGGFIPMEILWTMQSVNVFVSLTSKLLQVYTNYKNGYTGQLSTITVHMLLLGSLARIFTSIQETGDFLAIFGNSVCFFANIILTSQMWYYREATKLKFN